jgi:hypothetical protein
MGKKSDNLSGHMLMEIEMNQVIFLLIYRLIKAATVRINQGKKKMEMEKQDQPIKKLIIFNMKLK